MAKRLTIEEMQKLAANKKGICLSLVYINARKKLHWRCRFDHEWFATGDSIKRGSWCPICNGGHKWTVEEVKEKIEKRGGTLISKIISGSEGKIKVRCSKGHFWEVRLANIIKGTWCPNCIGRHRTISDMKKVAKEKGGKCLSKKYQGATFPLKWKCKLGHIWKTPPSLIFYGRWCPECGGSKKLTISDMKKLAQQKNGRCISKKYINSGTKLLWECEKFHRWEATQENIKGGSWCPTCSGRAKLTIEDMQQLAKSHEGQCISQTYKNGFEKLEWLCKFNHSFFASYESVKGSPGKKSVWCKKCSGRTSEEIVRYAIERLTGKYFPKVRPTWIRNKQGCKLELDGYCEELKIAFEHQGHHHFKQSKAYKHTKIEFDKIVAHDKIKETICKKMNIALIKVPQLFVELRTDELIPFLRKSLLASNTKIKLKIIKIEDVLSALGKDKLSKLKNIAIAKGGLCLSNFYVNARAKMQWRCINGHEWLAEAYRVEKGSWCRHCAGKAKLTIERMQEEAKKRGGLCLSKYYKGKDYKLMWECGRYEHQWLMTWNNVRHGQWCPKCSKIKKIS